MKQALPALVFGILLCACGGDRLNTRRHKQQLSDTLFHLCGLRPEIKSMRVLKDSLRQTPGTFEADYSWHVQVRYDEKQEGAWLDIIHRSPKLTQAMMYDLNNAGWKMPAVIQQNGVWQPVAGKGYLFSSIHHGQDNYTILVDTVKNELRLRLDHI